MSPELNKIILVTLALLAVVIIGLLAFFAFSDHKVMTVQGTDGVEISVANIVASSQSIASNDYEDLLLVFEVAGASRLSYFKYSNQFGLEIFGANNEVVEANLSQAERLVKQYLKISSETLCTLPITIADRNANLLIFPSCRDGNE